MAAYNRPYPTLHSPDEPMQYSLHTPIEPQSAVYPQTPSQTYPQENIPSFPPPPTSQTASQYATEQYHASAPPPPPPSQSAMSVTIASDPGSRSGSPGFTPPSLTGGESYMMTPQQPRSPPPTFEQYQAQYQQSSSPPPAFAPHDPNSFSTQQYPETASEQRSLSGHRPPTSPVSIHVPIYHPSDPIGPQTPKTPIYTPGAAAGPNGGVHAPGQIGHPNQQHGIEPYHHGLCDCFSDMSTCCVGYWCPCILYSRTHHRLKTAPNSSLKEFKPCNTHCVMFCILAPVSWIFTTIQRLRIRENYRLEGSVAGDCAKAYCCVMCTLVQDDREVCHREDERRRFAGPGNGEVGDVGYRRQTGMVYS